MSTISAKDVMKLSRNKTSLAMMECKKALVEAEGDIEKAEILLRKKLKGKMEAKADRVAGEGRVEIARLRRWQLLPCSSSSKPRPTSPPRMISFINAIQSMSQAIAIKADAGSPSQQSDEMTALIDELRITTGENISIDSIEKLSGDRRHYLLRHAYVHHDGKTGSLVQVEGSRRSRCPQANSPCMSLLPCLVLLGITPDDISAELVEKERKFRLEQAVESGKPQEIAEKMVEGGMKKFFSEVALLEQPFIMEPSKKISSLIGDATVSQFRRWAIGEAE